MQFCCIVFYVLYRQLYVHIRPREQCTSPLVLSGLLPPLWGSVGFSPHACTSAPGLCLYCGDTQCGTQSEETRSRVCMRFCGNSSCSVVTGTPVYPAFLRAVRSTPVLLKPRATSYLAVQRPEAGQKKVSAVEPLSYAHRRPVSIARYLWASGYWVICTLQLVSPG